MSAPKLEEVYKTSGTPSFTFVRPVEYDRLSISLRTPGRGLVIEGPSGIGKTSAIVTALKELGIDQTVTKLSARRLPDLPAIARIAHDELRGTLIVDDFHRLDNLQRSQIADYVKTLADDERTDVKVVLIGINKAGEALIAFGADLSTRMDIIRFEANPPESVRELVEKGEKALNVRLVAAPEIVKAAAGSFFIAQMLCHEACLAKRVMEGTAETTTVDVSYELIRTRVFDALARKFMGVAKRFAAGPKLRREGRAPYLHILKWLAESRQWSISLDEEPHLHPTEKASVTQVVDKGFLESFLSKNSEFGHVMHFDSSSHVLSVEDPQFVYFLRNNLWNKFAQQVGYIDVRFSHSYDFALSFAGADRQIAKGLADRLVEMEFQVFYDHDEQHKIMAEDLEEYLGPIYRSEAEYVVCLLGPDYPKRVWTKFESKEFEDRFGKGSVIPVLFSNVPIGAFDKASKVGSFAMDVGAEVGPQLDQLADLVRRKIFDDRTSRRSEAIGEPPAPLN